MMMNSLQFGHVLIKGPLNQETGERYRKTLNDAMSAAKKDGYRWILDARESTNENGTLVYTIKPKFDKYVLEAAQKNGFEAEVIALEPNYKPLDSIPWSTVLFYPFVIKSPNGIHPVGGKLLALINWPKVIIAKIKGEF
jgi:hypothetical protein